MKINDISHSDTNMDVTSKGDRI